MNSILKILSKQKSMLNEAVFPHGPYKGKNPTQVPIDYLKTWAGSALESGKWDEYKYLVPEIMSALGFDNEDELKDWAEKKREYKYFGKIGEKYDLIIKLTDMSKVQKHTSFLYEYKGRISEKHTVKFQTLESLHLETGKYYKISGILKQQKKYKDNRTSHLSGVQILSEVTQKEYEDFEPPAYEEPDYDSSTIKVGDKVLIKKNANEIDPIKWAKLGMMDYLQGSVVEVVQKAISGFYVARKDNPGAMWKMGYIAIEKKMPKDTPVTHPIPKITFNSSNIHAGEKVLIKQNAKSIDSITWAESQMDYIQGSVVQVYGTDSNSFKILRKDSHTKIWTLGYITIEKKVPITTPVTHPISTPQPQTLDKSTTYGQHNIHTGDSVRIKINAKQLEGENWLSPNMDSMIGATVEVISSGSQAFTAQDKDGQRWTLHYYSIDKKKTEAVPSKPKIQKKPVEEVEVPHFKPKGNNMFIDVDDVREEIKNIIETYIGDSKSQDELFDKMVEENNRYAIFAMPFFYKRKTLHDKALDYLIKKKEGLLIYWAGIEENLQENYYEGKWKYFDYQKALPALSKINYDLYRRARLKWSRRHVEPAQMKLTQAAAAEEKPWETDEEEVIGEDRLQVINNRLLELAGIMKPQETKEEILAEAFGRYYYSRPDVERQYETDEEGDTIYDEKGQAQVSAKYKPDRLNVEQLFWDFYGITGCIWVSPKTEKKDMFGQPPKRSSWRLHKIDHIVSETLEDITYFQADTLLDSVFFCLAAEFRHIFDHSSKSKHWFQNRGQIDFYNKYKANYQGVGGTLAKGKKRYAEGHGGGRMKSYKALLATGMPKHKIVEIIRDNFGTVTTLDSNWASVSKKKRAEEVGEAITDGPDMDWSGGFGGYMWGNIAVGWLMLYNATYATRLPPIESPKVKAQKAKEEKETEEELAAAVKKQEEEEEAKKTDPEMIAYEKQKKADAARKKWKELLMKGKKYEKEQPWPEWYPGRSIKEEEEPQKIPPGQIDWEEVEGSEFVAEAYPNRTMDTYNKLHPIIGAIDHIYDLEHNNNIVFDKLNNWLKGDSLTWLKRALDWRAHEKSLWRIWNEMSEGLKSLMAAYMYEVSGETAEAIIGKEENFGIFGEYNIEAGDIVQLVGAPQPPPKIEQSDEERMKFVEKWGEKIVQVTNKSGKNSTGYYFSAVKYGSKSPTGSYGYQTNFGYASIHKKLKKDSEELKEIQKEMQEKEKKAMEAKAAEDKKKAEETAKSMALAGKVNQNDIVKIKDDATLPSQYSWLKGKTVGVYSKAQQNFKVKTNNQAQVDVFLPYDAVEKVVMPAQPTTFTQSNINSGDKVLIKDNAKEIDTLVWDVNGKMDYLQGKIVEVVKTIEKNFKVKDQNSDIVWRLGYIAIAEKHSGMSEELERLQELSGILTEGKKKKKKKKQAPENKEMRDLDPQWDEWEQYLLKPRKLKQQTPKKSTYRWPEAHKGYEASDYTGSHSYADDYWKYGSTYTPPKKEPYTLKHVAMPSLPGKLYTHRRPEWNPEIPEQWKEKDIKIVVSLLEKGVHSPTFYGKHDVRAVNRPIKDYSVPTYEEAKKTIQFIYSKLKQGINVSVHCFGGNGRTGTIVALLYSLVNKKPMSQTLEEIRKLNHKYVENKVQEKFVHDFVKQYIEERRMKKEDFSKSSKLFLEKLFN